MQDFISFISDFTFYLEDVIGVYENAEQESVSAGCSEGYNKGKTRKKLRQVHQHGLEAPRSNELH